MGRRFHAVQTLRTQPWHEPCAWPGSNKAGQEFPVPKHGEKENLFSLAWHGDA